MQVIELKHPYDPKLIVDQPVVLALGFFDGVHLGQIGRASCRERV